MSREEGSSLNKQQMREGDWMCAECEAHNYNARMSCFRCHLSKEKSELKRKGKAALDWECFECKTSNFSWRDECYKCHITRFQSEDLKARQVGVDWYCRFCDLKNFPNRSDCFKCKKPRDQCEMRGPPPPAMNRGRSPGRKSPIRLDHRRSPPRHGPMSPHRGRSPPGRGRSPFRGRSPPPRGRSPLLRGHTPPRPQSPYRGRSPPRGRSPFRGRSPRRRSPMRARSPLRQSPRRRSPLLRRSPRRDMSPHKRGRSRSPVRAMSPARGGDEWRCNLCSSVNGVRYSDCFKCGTRRDQGRQGPSCGPSNQGSLLGQVFGPDEKRGGDWDCPQCNVNNFHFRKECFKCKAAKPAFNLNESKASDYRPDDYYEPESPPKRRKLDDSDNSFNARQQFGPDWVCKFCKVDVFPTRSDCYKCGGSREECEMTQPQSSNTAFNSLGNAANVGHSGNYGGGQQGYGGSSSGGTQGQPNAGNYGNPGGSQMSQGPYSGPKVAQGYSCVCGNFNRVEEVACIQCGKPNSLVSGGPSQPEPQYSQPGPMIPSQPLPNVDWTCMECRANNYHHRQSCFKCKKSRDMCEDRSSWVSRQGDGGERRMNQGRDGRRDGRSPDRRTSDVHSGPGSSRYSPVRRYSPPPPQRRDSGRAQSPGRSSSYYNCWSPPRQQQQRGRSPNNRRSPRRDEGKEYDPDWQCRECKINNFVKRQKCFRCGKDRSEVEVLLNSDGKPIGPDDWLCPSCNGHNYSRRTDCYKCHTAKPISIKRESSGRGSGAGGNQQQNDPDDGIRMQGNIDRVEIVA